MADIVGTVRAIVTPLAVVLVVALVMTAGVIAVLGGLGVAVTAVADLFGSSADSGQADGPAPDATFVVEAADGGATVEHVGGESADASVLFLEVDGEPVGAWSELSGDDGDVEEGDAVTVDNVSTGQSVTVRWVSGEHSIPLHTGSV